MANKQQFTVSLANEKDFVNGIKANIMLLDISDSFKFCNFKTRRKADSIDVKFTFFDKDVIYACSKHANCAKWGNLQCTSLGRIKTKCSGRTKADKEKLFVKGYKNMFEFITHSQSMDVHNTSASLNTQLWILVYQKLMKNLDLTFFNHNRDQNTLHIKFEKS